MSRTLGYGVVKWDGEAHTGNRMWWHGDQAYWTNIRYLYPSRFSALSSLYARRDEAHTQVIRLVRVCVVTAQDVAAKAIWRERGEVMAELGRRVLDLEHGGSSMDKGYGELKSFMDWLIVREYKSDSVFPIAPSENSE